MRRTIGISKIALKGIAQRPLRSFLTSIASAIAIASIISTVSITNGANKAIRSAFTNLGTNIIAVQSKDSMVSKLSKSSDAMNIIRSLPGISNVIETRPIDLSDVKRLQFLLEKYKAIVTPAIVKKANIFIGDDPKGNRRTIVGIEADYFNMLSIPLVAGRMITQEEIVKREKVCILDEMTVYMLYPFGTKPADVIGRTLTLSEKHGNYKLRIIGILKDPQVMRTKKKEVIDVGRIARSTHYSRLEFINIYVSLYLLENVKIPKINSIFVAPSNIEDVDVVEAKVKSYMTSNKKAAFVWAQKKWIFATLEALEQLTSFSRYIWIMILVVAMVMILTITLVSVRERYYEIAIRMTEGATKFRIMLQFAIESIFLAIAGGITGIVFGYFLIRILRYYFIRWEAPIELHSIALAFVSSLAIGILTSIPTAKHAASLNPVDVFRMH